MSVQCFVGHWKYSGVFNFISPFVHPSEFGKRVAELKHDIYTNNPAVMNEFTGDKIIVIDEFGNQIFLNQMDDFDSLSKTFGCGEIYWMAGEDWIAPKLASLDCEVRTEESR